MKEINKIIIAQQLWFIEWVSMDSKHIDDILEATDIIKKEIWIETE